MILELAFGMVFVAGPAAFWLLSTQDATRMYVIGLWVVTLGLMALAYGMGTYGMTLSVGPFYMGVTVLASFWLAWITMLALIMLAVRRLGVSRGVRRAAFAIGAMATTLPWFGLYAARMVAE
jgi:hypothetical protein